MLTPLDRIELPTGACLGRVFEAYRGHFGPKRTSGARALHEDDQGSLFTARQLAVRTVGSANGGVGFLNSRLCVGSIQSQAKVQWIHSQANMTLSALMLSRNWKSFAVPLVEAD